MLLSTHSPLPKITKTNTVTLLRFAHRGLNVEYDAECEKRYWQSYNMAVGCWNAVMSNLGLALRHRSHNYESDSIVYYHDRDIRGFNMIYTHHDEMLSSQIHPIRIWRQGDFIAHVTHSPTDNIHKRWKHLVEYFEPYRYTAINVFSVVLLKSYLKLDPSTGSI